MRRLYTGILPLLQAISHQSQVMTMHVETIYILRSSLQEGNTNAGSNGITAIWGLEECTLIAVQRLEQELK